MSKPLTATMVAAIELANEFGGELVRFQGGYWAGRSAARSSHDGIPRPHHGATTVNALVARGYATFTEWRQRGDGTTDFPIAMRLAEIERMPA